MKEIIIPQNSSAYLKVLVATSIPTAYLGYLFFGFMTNGSAYNVYVMFLCSILFFICLSVLVRSIIQFLNKKPALIINDKGIVDNISIAKAGFIEWRNISDCFVAKMSGVDQLFIKLKDYNSILEKQNQIKKGLLSVPISDHGTPIAIDLKVLNYNPSKLQKLIINRKKGR